MPELSVKAAARAFREVKWKHPGLDEQGGMLVQAIGASYWTQTGGLLISPQGVGPQAMFVQVKTALLNFGRHPQHADCLEHPEHD